MEGELGGKKKRSFSYEIGEGDDQKLKLIDISSEEDSLIDSPFFDSLEDLRLSVTLDNMHENGGSRTSLQRDKTTKVKELLHLSSIQPGRPSYLRRSFAWDHSFFTNAGLLDQHELTLMNEGFDTLEEHLLPVILEDVRARRPDLLSTCTSECCKVNQFKNRKLPVHGSKHMFSELCSRCESGLENTGLQNALSSKKVGTGSGDMVNCRPVHKRKTISHARAARYTEQTCKRRDCNSIDLNIPKVPRTRESASTWQSKVSSLEVYPVNSVGKKRTGAGHGLTVSNSTIRSLTPQNVPPSKTFCEKSKLFASVSSSKTPTRSSTQSKTFENLSSSMEINVSNHLSKKSPRSTTNGWSLDSSSSTSVANQAHSDSNFGLNTPFGSTENYRSPSQLTGGVASVLRKNSQPSGLCMPSPKLGFFDEDKSPGSTLDENLNPSKKQGMSASIDTSGEAYCTKVKRARRLLPSPTIMPRHAAPLHKSENASSRVCSKSRKVGTGEHERKKVGVLNKRDEKGMISGTCRLRMQENDLSRYLEIIDLNDTQLEQKMNSFHKRTPLIERN